MRRVTLGFFILSVPVFATPVFAQGDAKDMMQQGFDMLRSGDDAGALEKFRAVISANPTNEDAWRLWKEVEQSGWVRMLAKGGEYEQIARALIARATPSMGEYKKDPAAIEPLIADALSDDFAKRQHAIAKLAGNHGPYTIQYLVGGLSDAGDDNRRIRAMEAAFRIAGAGVPPLVSLLDSPDATARRSAIVVLARLKDARGMARIAHLAEADGDSVVRAEAKQASAGVSDAAKALGMESLMYLRLDHNYVRPTDSNNIAWECHDGKLVDMEIPSSLYGVEMARRAALRSVAAKNDNPMALGALAMAHAEARILARGLNEASAKVINEKLPTLNEGLRLCGASALMSGLAMSIEMGDSRLATELIKEIADNTTRGDSAAANALAETSMLAKNREVRLSGAAAAAYIDGKIVSREDVTKLLAEAVGERVQRIAVIIDENAGRNAAMKSAFEGARWYAACADTGISGIARIRRFAGADLILISSSLKDITAEELITELRADERTKNVTILAIADEKEVEGSKSRFGDKVKNVIAKFDGAAIDATIEGTELNPERMRAEELASIAARALASAPELASGGRAAAMAACADAAMGRADSVRIPAIDTLGRFGGESSLAALATVLTDANASNPAKASAGLALAGIGSRGIAYNEAATQALGAALSHTDAGVRSAAATALGRAAGLDATMRAKLLMEKQMTLTTGGGAAAPAAGGGSN
ncbi:MAG: hypothetical protein ACKVS6_16995 [Planctomycetota bacterium]